MSKLAVNIPLLLLCLGLAASTWAQSSGHTASDKAPYVILKLDDLWHESGLVHPGWQMVVQYLNEQQVTGTIGLICDSLEEGDSTYFRWITDRQDEGYEIWHHGYCHCKPDVNGQQAREFRGTDYAYQLAHITRAQQLAQDKLGITLRSFGAPYNSTDSLTVQAMAQVPELEVWMYKETSYATEKHVLPRIEEVNIEYPVHVPDFEQFKTGYEKHRAEEVLVIQGHPRSWTEDPARFQAFQQIIEFLQADGARFTTPYAYYRMIAKN